MNTISIDAHKLVKRIEKDTKLTIIDRYYGNDALHPPKFKMEQKYIINHLKHLEMDMI